MLNRRTLPIVLAVCASVAGPAAAQELAPHRAAYVVSALQHGRPSAEAVGTYAFELKLECDGYTINQRLRLEMDGGRNAVVSEQQTQMSESRDGRRLKFEHRSTANGRATNVVKGEAMLDDDGRGQSRFGDPEGQSVALPAGTLFPVALSRATVAHAKAGDDGFDGLFFFGEKVKPPMAVHMILGRVPKRLAELAIPKGAEALAAGRERIYFRGGFFEAAAKKSGEQPAFEMSSVTLDNGIELYGTHEEGESGIEYRINRLEPLPRPTCH